MEMINNTPIIEALSAVLYDEIVEVSYFSTDGTFVENRKITHVKCIKDKNDECVILGTDIKMSGSTVYILGDNLICFNIIS